MSLPRLLVLTDRRQLPRGRSLLGTLVECRPFGLTHVVLRELDLPDAERAGLAEQLTEAGLEVIAAHRRLPTCVGVHLPSGGRATSGAWGRSCHSAEDVARAAVEGAGWVTLSPFAESASKPGHGPTLPMSAFAGHPVPVFALGGVDATNAGDPVASGAHGVAVMGAVMRADRPGRVVRRLLELTA